MDLSAVPAPFPAGPTVARWLALSFSLPRRVEHERITRKVVRYHGRYHHVANLRSAADLDDSLRSWLSEAYLSFSGMTVLPAPGEPLAPAALVAYD